MNAWEGLRHHNHRVIRPIMLIAGKNLKPISYIYKPFFFFSAATTDLAMRFNTLFFLLILSCVCLALAQGTAILKKEI